jgi:hypothetical protein
VAGRYYWQEEDIDQTVLSFVTAFTRLRTDPWANNLVMLRALRLLPAIAEHHPETAVTLFDAISEPFAVSVLEGERRLTMLEIAKFIDDRLAAQVINSFEPHVPWTGPFLADRVDYYRATGDPLTARAERDLDAFAAASSPAFSQTLN